MNYFLIKNKIAIKIFLNLLFSLPLNKLIKISFNIFSWFSLYLLFLFTFVLIYLWILDIIKFIF